MQYAPTANTSEQGKLRRALRTLRLILSSPTTREYRKLPEHTSSDSQTDHLPLLVHPSWRDHIPHQDLQHTRSWLQTLFRSPAPRSTKTTHTHSYELHRTATELPEFDVVRVTGHRHKGKQLHYRVEWTLEHLTDQQIADQEALGFEIQHRTPTIVPIALQKTLRGRPKCPVCNLQVAPIPLLTTDSADPETAMPQRTYAAPLIQDGSVHGARSITFLSIGYSRRCSGNPVGSWLLMFSPQTQGKARYWHTSKPGSHLQSTPRLGVGV